MNCIAMREHYSDLYEGALPPEIEDQVRRHLAECAGCDGDYAGFVAATDALRSSQHTPATPAYVASILGAIRADRPATNLRLSWRSLLTHAAAAAAGALLVFQASNRAGSESPDAAPEVSTASPALRVELTAGTAVLERAGRASTAAGRSFDLRIGDVLRAERVDSLAFELGSDGSLRLSAPQFEAPPPEVVQQVVEIVREVQRPVLAPSELVAGIERAAALLGNRIDAAYLAVVRALDRGAQTDRASSALTPPPEGTALAATVAQPGAQPGGRGSSPTTSHARPPAVRIEREGGRLRLETRGRLDEVIPTLIVQLGSREPGVPELIERRLSELRAELARQVELADPADGRPAKPMVAAPSLAGILFGEREPAEPGTSADSQHDWSQWWEANAERVARAQGERAY